MASSSSSNYTIIWVDDPAKVKKAVSELGRERTIAVDGEGFNLSREGTLDILSIATRHKDVYLFDISKMDRLAFDSGLKRLLECSDDVTTKLMYDCRNDSDALMHKFDVKLGGVLDLQLLEIVHRRNKGQGTEYLRGLKKCLDTYVNDRRIGSVKEKGISEIERGKKENVNIWAKRPLDFALKEYCAVDTASLFPLHNVLGKRKNEADMSIVLKGSEKYANYFRSYETLPKKEFIFHPFLPNNILEFYTAKTSQTGDVPLEACKGCLIEFNKHELSSDTTIGGFRLCSVCAKIARREMVKTGQPMQL